MADDVTPESSPATTDVSDLFYPKTEAASSPAPEEKQTPPSAPEEQPGETESDPEPEEQEEPAEPEAGKVRDEHGKFIKRSDATSRIKQLLAEKRELEARLAEARESRRESSDSGKPQPAATEKPTEEAKAELEPPDLSDPKYDVPDGVLKWQADNRKFLKEFRAATIKEAIETQARQQAQQQRTAKIQEQLAKVREKYPDYADVVTNQVQIDDVTAKYIGESDLFGELLYYFGKNPDEAKRLRSLPELRRGVELGRIEARIEGNGSSKEHAKVPPPNKNLKPPKTVSGNQSRPQERSMEEIFYGKG